MSNDGIDTMAVLFPDPFSIAEYQRAQERKCVGRARATGTSVIKFRKFDSQINQIGIGARLRMHQSSFLNSIDAIPMGCFVLFAKRTKNTFVRYPTCLRV